MHDSSALTFGLITCCQPCLFWNSTSGRSPDNVTAFCLVNTSSILTFRVLCLLVPPASLSESCVQKSTHELFCCEVVACLSASVNSAVVKKRRDRAGIHPGLERNEWVDLSFKPQNPLPFTKKDFSLTCPSSTVCSVPATRPLSLPLYTLKREDAISSVVFLRWNYHNKNNHISKGDWSLRVVRFGVDCMDSMRMGNKIIHLFSIHLCLDRRITV